MKIPKPADGIVWITGASSGIGLALAEAHLARGWTVAVTARRAEPLQALAARFPGRVIVQPADITDADAINAAVAAIEAGQKIARAILNAGTYERDTAETFSAARFRRQVDLNLTGTAICLEAIMPRMIARNAGQIGLVASLAGLAGLPGSGSYSATKAGLIALAESLKFDLDKRGVAISAICPGFVKSPLTAKNTFPMPFLMEADAAANTIIKGLDANTFMIAFPEGLARPLRILRSLPYGVFFPLIARGTKGQD
ncbi:MAG: SDR family NAD(P)-dependent oxidoreductase [Proteobacteria bacterium]|nr:SDR family NAD(P)-dependent oxidoreductase [Pseudomonadota bacterium]